ncbi:hypothetical protein L9F63_026912, partial [Diploptera punctata]
WPLFEMTHSIKTRMYLVLNLLIVLEMYLTWAYYSYGKLYHCGLPFKILPSINHNCLSGFHKSYWPTHTSKYVQSLSDPMIIAMTFVLLHTTISSHSSSSGLLSGKSWGCLCEHAHCIVTYGPLLQEICL